MFTLDFRSNPRSAFAHGFLKGLASPAMLYYREGAPELPQFAAITPPSYSIAEALAGDWVRIGADMSRVIERNDKTSQQASK
jgi:hypothetical protein